MGFLHKLWDETLAGPTPETGLGRLRKYNSFSAVRSPNQPMISRYHHDDHNHHPVNDHANLPVTRSITILRTRNFPSQPGSGPPSPAGSSGPPSPNSPAGSVKDQDVKRFTRKKQRFDAVEHAEITNTTVYDWIMISTLDS